MSFKTAFTSLSMIICLAVLSACASAPQYHQAERAPIGAADPVHLPDWPDGVLIVCPRGHWDPQANCPSGSEWIGYDSDSADQLQAFAIAGQANTRIAEIQAGQIAALDREASASNSTAGSLESEIDALERGRLLERLGWIGSLAAVIALAL